MNRIFTLFLSAFFSLTCTAYAEEVTKLQYKVHLQDASFFGWDLATEDTVNIILTGKVPLNEAGGIKIDSKLIPFNRKDGSFQSIIVLPLKDDVTAQSVQHQIQYFKLNGLTEVTQIDLSPAFQEIKVRLTDHGSVWFDYQKLSKFNFGINLGQVSYSQSFAGKYSSLEKGVSAQYERLGLIPGFRFFAEGLLDQGSFSGGIQFFHWVLSSGFGFPILSFKDIARFELVAGASISTLNGDNVLGYASLGSMKLGLFSVFHVGKIGNVALHVEYEPIINPGVTGGIKRAGEIIVSDFSSSSFINKMSLFLSYQVLDFKLATVQIKHDSINGGLSYRF